MSETRPFQIIGEKINGTRARVVQAIQARDHNFIRTLAVKQAQAGAAWLDVNAGTRQASEPDDLIWLVETIQSVVEIPLCLDSANPQALAAAIQVVERTPMINSINGEKQRLEGILPLVAEHGCQVIALAMDGKGVPEVSTQRMDVIRDVMQAIRTCGVPDEHVYLDPLAMALATNTQSALVTLETIRAIRDEYPEAHLTMGLSNISFGLPARSQINRTFLTLAIAAGLDCAILDPLDQDLMAALVTTKSVLGRDRHCLEYTHAYRAGLFGRLSAAAVQS
jgi:cobalamin-dependent methionine synthase I